MAAGTLFVLDASLPGGLVEGAGDVRSAFVHLFTNRAVRRRPTLSLTSTHTQPSTVLEGHMLTALRHFFSNGLLAVAASLAIMVAIGSLIAPSPVIAEKPTAVTIVSPVPLPVSGTLGVSGTVEVNVANQPVVTIANSDASPLVVRSVAEIPYQRSTFFNQGADTCTDFVCEVTFDEVPAGYRLVVTYVSARYAMSGTQNNATVRVGSTFGTSILLPPPVQIGTTNWATGSPVTFYFEAGETPRLSLGGQFVSGVSNTAHASIVGRLEPVS